MPPRPSFSRFNATQLRQAAIDFDIQNGGRKQIVRNAIFTFGDLDPYYDSSVNDYDMSFSEVVRMPCKFKS